MDGVPATTGVLTGEDGGRRVRARAGDVRGLRPWRVEEEHRGPREAGKGQAMDSPWVHRTERPCRHLDVSPGDLHDRGNASVLQAAGVWCLVTPRVANKLVSNL